MKYKYTSNVPLAVKGKMLKRGDVIELKEEELKNLPYWRFKKLEKEKGGR